MAYQLRVQLPESFFAWNHYSMKNQRKGSDYQCGLEGFFDMAKVDGEYFYDWGTHVERLFPGKYKMKRVKLLFISVDLDATIQAFQTDAGGFMASSGNLVIDQFDGTQSILYDGKYKLVSGPKFKSINDNYGTVEIEIEIEETFETASLSSVGAGYMLNGFPLFTNFGLSVSSLDGFFDSRKRLTFNDIQWPNTSGANLKDVQLNGVVSASDFVDFNTKLKRLRELLKESVDLTTPGGITKSVYAPVGFKVTRIASNYENTLFAGITINFKM